MTAPALSPRDVWRAHIVGLAARATVEGHHGRARVLLAAAGALGDVAPGGPTDRVLRGLAGEDRPTSEMTDVFFATLVGVEDPYRVVAEAIQLEATAQADALSAAVDRLNTDGVMTAHDAIVADTAAAQDRRRAQ